MDNVEEAIEVKETKIYIQEETSDHVLLECGKYRRGRQILNSDIQKNKVLLRIKEILQRNTDDVVNRIIFSFLRAAGSYIRIKM